MPPLSSQSKSLTDLSLDRFSGLQVVNLSRIQHDRLNGSRILCTGCVIKPCGTATQYFGLVLGDHDRGPKTAGQSA